MDPERNAQFIIAKDTLVKVTLASLRSSVMVVLCTRDDGRRSSYTAGLVELNNGIDRIPI